MALHDKTLVIDATVHAINSSPEARAGNPYARAMVDGTFAWQAALIPDEYVLDEKRYRVLMSAETLTSALFYESQTDIGCFHHVPVEGIIKDNSPIRVGLAIRERYPHRMLIYGGVSPLNGLNHALEEIERLVTELKVNGIKLYPLDMIDGKIMTYSMADEKLLYPIYEKCIAMGLKAIAVHKALPLGPTQMDPYRVGDVDYAARDFPNLAFEVVHAGLAFLDESAWQIRRFDNIYVGLEATAQQLCKFPDKFARIIGEFLQAGGEDRLFWSTGCTFTHAQPLIEAFEKFQMPQYLVDGGYPQITPEVKAKILGLNYARLHGLDLTDIKRKIAADDIEAEKVKGLRKPWSRA